SCPCFHSTSSAGSSTGGLLPLIVDVRGWHVATTTTYAAATELRAASGLPRSMPSCTARSAADQDASRVGRAGRRLYLGRGRLKDGILTSFIVPKFMERARRPQRTYGPIWLVLCGLVSQTANGRYSFMHTTERTEARIEDANNILVAPSTLQDDGLIKDFFGPAIALED